VITAIDVDPETDDLWLGTWGGGLVRFSAGRFDKFDQLNGGLAGDLVFAVAVAGERVWAATNAGLSSFDPIREVWDLHAERRSDAPESVVTSLGIRRDQLYVASWCEGIRRLDLAEETPALVGLASVGDGAETPLALTSADASVWWATETGVYRDGGDGTWAVRKIPGRPTGLVRSLAAPADREVWLGTESGLRILTDWETDAWMDLRRSASGGQGLVTFSQAGNTVGTRIVNSIFPDDRVYCVAFGTDEVWVGTARGVARGTDRRPWTGLNPHGASGAAATASSAVMRDPAPGVPERVIGFLGPFIRPIALPGDASPLAIPKHRADQLAAELAVDQANGRGGTSAEDPFRVVIGIPEFTYHGWGTPEDDFIRFAYRDRALGILASLEPHSRISSAVALFTEVPLVNAASGPASIDERINPWMFRCPINDPLKHGLLMDSVLDSSEQTRLVVLRTPGAQARMHLEWWSAALIARGQAPVSVLDLDPDGENLDSVVQAIGRSEATVVLTWADLSLSADILRRLRETGLDPLFVGSDRIVNDEFVGRVGRDPGRVIAPYPCSHRRDAEAAVRFGEQYARRSSGQRAAGPEAYRIYDATRHLAQAIDIAGSDREAIRQTLREMDAATFACLEQGQWTGHSLSEPSGCSLARPHHGRVSHPGNGARSRR
jgi:ABC-type branched-subunit amino acid transport system substrate-binding protein